MIPSPLQPATPAARFYRAFYSWIRASNPQSRSWHTSLHNNSRTSSYSRRYNAARSLSSAAVRRSAAAEKQEAQEQQDTKNTQAVRGSNTTNTNVLPSLSTHVRHLMRRVPHPVVVITASQPPSASGIESGDGTSEALFRGMTVSSFNTVTLEPVPLVSFNVRVPSSTHTAISESAFFLAHLLAATPTGVQIAHAFARGANTGGEAFRALAGSVRIMTGKATNGAPLLAGGVMQVLKCRPLPEKEILVGDHMVLVAEVLGILGVPSAGDKVVESAEELSGLIYGAQGYRQLGPEIDAPVNERAPEPEPDVQKTLGLNVRRGDEVNR